MTSRDLILVAASDQQQARRTAQFLEGLGAAVRYMPGARPEGVLLRVRQDHPNLIIIDGHLGPKLTQGIVDIVSAHTTLSDIPRLLVGSGEGALHLAWRANFQGLLDPRDRGAGLSLVLAFLRASHVPPRRHKHGLLRAPAPTRSHVTV